MIVRQVEAFTWAKSTAEIESDLVEVESEAVEEGPSRRAKKARKEKRKGGRK